MSLDRSQTSGVLQHLSDANVQERLTDIHTKEPKILVTDSYNQKITEHISYTIYPFTKSP